ncbi:hypothetical protein [Plantactinospora sp. WMMB782]|uniref:hypothetical protein n=1 Tax=Plantactinospora sp. WMMB782 TaxID=3404121 RepID=UPI003B9552BA
MDRRFADRKWLAAVVRDGLGTDRRIDELTRLRGGTKKGVYRLGLDDRSTVVAYVWSPDENYWPERLRSAGDDPSGTAGRVDDPARDVFGDASGSELFEAADAVLVAAGVRTPEVRHYSPLAVDGLDERRLRLYQLAQHLSLVAGPLRLLDGDFPDRDFMRGIAAHHAERVLAFRP